MIQFLTFLLFFVLTLATADAEAISPYAFAGAAKASATQTVGGTSQQLLAANPGRKLFCVQNPAGATESYWIDFGRAAVVGSSMEVPAGQMVCMGGVASVWTGVVNGNATTTSHQIVVYEFN